LLIQLVRKQKDRIKKTFIASGIEIITPKEQKMILINAVTPIPCLETMGIHVQAWI